ncbi:MAG TPA: penicillin-binding transpeptidase domain-containing protein [Candidatus Levybacteria bacterium]|nr:penicillin-binding transpeptidase domain-containing protein [Candidatus Levybacteria bacterium]
MRKKYKTGIAFSDFVTRERSMFSSGKNNSSVFQPSELLLMVPAFLLICLFLILFLRLFYVQVVQGAYYAGLSDQNRTRTITIPAPRGIIFDRYNRPIVRNVPIFEIFENKKAKLIGKDQALQLLSQGKDVKDTITREYLYGSNFANIIGYTGQISEEELNSPEYKEYVITDFVGKMGLEDEYEKVLHGENGKELYEVNAAGEKSRFLGRQEPISGKNITATLDIDIQQAASNAMKDVKKGAVVVSNPKDGGILALYTKPTYDSNIFTHSKEYKAEGDYKDVNSILSDTENQPLLDRAIGGVYPPGSTFKLVTAVAALSSGAITADTKIEDTGILRVGSFSFGNWYFLQHGRKDGFIDVVAAIKRSNDIFFYKAADETGVDTLSRWAMQFGLGNTLGIDLPGEVTGTVPTREWKDRVISEQWYLGDTFNYGIGQGYLLTTPLQVNFMTSVVANGGDLFKPHIIQGTGKKLKENLVKKEYLDLVLQGMKESCEVGGVAWPFFDFKVKNDALKIDNTNYVQDASGSSKMVRVKVGCKTGTAETGGKETKPHAWITVFAPFYNPEVVVTVLVENGGEGSSIAGPVARDVLKVYFEKKKN